MDQVGFLLSAAFVMTVFPLLACDLVQVNSSAVLCPNDEAVFVCTVENSVGIRWSVFNRISTRSFFFAIGEDMVGDLQNIISDTFIIRGGITSVSNSFLTTKVLLTIDPSLNGTTITCGTEELTFYFKYPAAPSKIQLFPLTHGGSVKHFTVIWMDTAYASIDTYSISVLPPPLTGLGNLNTSNTSAILSLSNHINYTISISTSYCPASVEDDSPPTHFFIGRCPFLQASAAVIVLHYNISSQREQSVLVRCGDGDEVVVECEEDGEWEPDVDSICQITNSSPECGILVLPDNSKLVNTSNNTERTSVSFQCEEGFSPSTVVIVTCNSGKWVSELISPYYCRTPKCTDQDLPTRTGYVKVTVFIAGVVCVCCVCVILNVVTFALGGLLCGRKYRKGNNLQTERRSSPSSTGSREVSGEVDIVEAQTTALYEEVVTPANFEFQDNVAYAQN